MPSSAKSILIAALSLVTLSLACSSLAELNPPKTWEYDENLGLDSVDSYTATLILEVSGSGDTGDIALDGDISGQRDPAASQMDFDASVDSSGQSLNLDVIVAFVDNTRYQVLDFGLGATCSDPADIDEEDFPFSFVEMFQQAGDTGNTNLFEDLPTMEYQNSEEINDVRSFHYHGEGDVDLDEGTLQDAVVDVWVAQDGGYVTQMQMSGTMQGSDAEGDYTLDYKVTSVNEPVDIEIPRACD